MKVIGTTEGNSYIVQMSKNEIVKMCGSQSSTDDFGTVYIGQEYTMNSIFENSSKLAVSGKDFAEHMNYLLDKLNQVHSQSKQLIQKYHEAIPHAKALVDFEIKATAGDRYNTRKVTLHENAPEYQCGRHD